MMQDRPFDSGGALEIDAADRAILFQAAARNLGITILLRDAQRRIAWMDSEHTDQIDPDTVLPDGSTFGDLLDKVLEDGLPQRVEVLTEADGLKRVHDVWVERVSVGTELLTLSTLVDVTEHWRKEQTLRTLLRELSHRSKNLLSIILSIATQTGRHSATIADFLVRFRGRVQSLAASQDLVTSSNWRGARLTELVHSQMEKYCEDPERGYRFVGDDPHLDPNAAMHVGLALHELTVNSVGFGALSQPRAAIEISMFRQKDGSHTLTWREDTRRPVVLSDKGRFGSVALERVVPAAVDGKATLTADGNFLTYRLDMPSTNFDRG